MALPFTVHGNGWIPAFEKRSHPTGGGGAFAGGPPKLVWHTFEGFAGNIDGAVAFLFGRKSGVYHVLVDVWQRRVVQLNGLTIAASSLRNGPHPVQTNRDGAIQICLTGSARDMDDLTADQLRWLGTHVLRPILEMVPGINAGRIERFYGENEGIVLATPRSKARMSEAAWDGFDGQCGHQHVPDTNDHWDPGRLNVTHITRFAAADATTPAAQPAAQPTPKPTPKVSAATGLAPGTALKAGESRRSPDGRYRLVFQDDGNLVLYGPSGAVWSSGTWGSGADRAVLQGDGNLVLYAGRIAVWATGTDGHRGAVLAVQSDGNVVLYAAAGAVWDSKGATGRKARRINHTYTVQRGNTLACIAGAFGTTAAHLAKINGLRDVNRIAVGQVLQVPAGGA